ncbi:MAG TPA: HAD family phosphatase [Candidatus Acidoferrum sp.]|nr:HAD family phosphatase [Candidatus Acidoferrum sp.]
MWLLFDTFLHQVCGSRIYKVLEESSLPKITTVFWDIGGVILTNGWDHESRKEAAATFHFDWDEFRDRHDLSFPAFDSGLITLNEYLDRTLFYRARQFSREEFTAFMFAQSKEYPETRAILDKVTNTRKYLVAALNNEPLELNQYRIEAFDLRRNFLVFFSSCYVRARKPEETIFRVALEVTQRPSEQCLFIDDRPLNLESPRKLGMNTIHHQSAEQLRAELGKYGVEV